MVMNPVVKCDPAHCAVGLTTRDGSWAEIGVPSVSLQTPATFRWRGALRAGSPGGAATGRDLGMARGRRPGSQGSHLQEGVCG